MSRRIITDEDLDNLLDDWFDRDGETFILKRLSDRLGWEEFLDLKFLSEAYTGKDLSFEEKLKLARNSAEDLITSMNVGKKFSVNISAKSGSYSNSDNLVHVSTKVFDDKSLEEGERFNVFYGVAIHEGAHLKYTDFSLVPSNRLKAYILNIIEDERIERLVGEHTPGYANFLESSKAYYFESAFLDKSGSLETPKSPLDLILREFLKAVRYPKYIDVPTIIEYFEYFEAIKESVSLPAELPEDSLNQTEEVYEIIRKFVSEKESEKASSDADSDSIEKPDVSGEGDSSDSEKSGDHKESTSDLEMEKKFDKEVPDKIKDLAAKRIEETSKLGDIEKLKVDGAISEGSTRDVIFTYAKENQKKYLEGRSKISRYIDAVSKTLKGHCKEFRLTHRSMKSGLLDTNKLAEAYQGVETIYMRHGEVKTDKIAVAVLIDESGSMGGKRMDAARETAILIKEAMSRIPNVELYVYGHTADSLRSGFTEIHVYYEHKRFTPMFAIGSASAEVENRDGVAIIETAKRVRQYTKEKCLFFVLSDGEPSASDYRGAAAKLDTREKVATVERLGFDVVQVCMLGGYDPGSMFKNFIILTDMNELAPKLATVIKKSIMNNTHSRVL